MCRAAHRRWLGLQGWDWELGMGLRAGLGLRALEVADCWCQKFDVFGLKPLCHLRKQLWFL